MAIIAAPVAAWATSAATSIGLGAAASTVGALAGSVAAGVVTGAVMGAATAAISGEDILDGALKGAVIGGISAGVLSGLGMATGLSTATDQMAGWGLAADGSALPSSTAATVAAPDVSAGIDSASSLPQGDTIPIDSLNGSQAMQNGSPGVATPTASVPANSGGILSNVGDSEILAGFTEGGMEALGSIGTSMMDASNDEDLAEWDANQAEITKANNIPGTFNTRVANIRVPKWWDSYLNPSVNTGLLARGAAV